MKSLEEFWRRMTYTLVFMYCVDLVVLIICGIGNMLSNNEVLWKIEVITVFLAIVPWIIWGICIFINWQFIEPFKKENK
jgi:ABC-type sugar transport system permease subunit